MIKTAFIVNGKSKNKKRFARDLDRYRHQLAGEFTVVHTSQAGHALYLAKELANEDFTHLIAVGGDGTLHEVVNGVQRSKNPACAVGLLPGGTANDFAKTMDARWQFEELVGMINNRVSIPIHLGLITFNDGSQKHFVNIADLGLGVDVVRRVNRSRRWLGANFTFFKAIIISLLTYKNKAIRVKTRDWEWGVKINSFVMANGKYFGSGLCIAPAANPMHDNFSIVIIGDITIKDYLKHVGKLKKGQRLQHPAVTYKTADTLEIPAEAQAALGTEADGEFIGDGSFKVTLAPQKLNFIQKMH